MTYVPQGEPGKRRYGKWAGKPAGDSENGFLCVVSVSGGAFGIVGQQCSRKRGHGLGAEYCKQHAKKLEAAK